MTHPAPSAPQRQGTTLRAALGIAAVLVLAVSGGVAASTASWSWNDVSEGEIAAIAAGIVGAASILLAFLDFRWFVVLLVVVRPSLDMLTSGTFGPALAVGLVLDLAAAVWLVNRLLRGTLIRPSLTTLALLSVAALGMLSCLDSVVPAASQVGAARLASGILMVVVIEQLVGARGDTAERLVRAMLVSSVVPLSVGLYQMLLAKTVTLPDGTSRVIGTFGHPNAYATYLGILIIVIVSRLATARSWWMRVVLAVLLAASLVTMYGTGARVAWIGLVLGLLYLVYRRRPILLVPLIAAVVLAVVFTPGITERFSDLEASAPREGVPANSLQWRLQFWQGLPHVSADDWVNGVGLETIPVVTSEKLQPHNVWLQSWVELGLLGFVTVGFAIVALGLSLHTRRVQGADRERRYAEVGIAAGLGLLLQTFSENLLTFPMAYWYLAIAAGYGFTSSADPAERLHLDLASTLRRARRRTDHYAVPEPHPQPHH